MSQVWTDEDDDAFAGESLRSHGDLNIELATTTECHNCGTAVRLRFGVGWTHELGFRERGGCGKVEVNV